jgi:putative transcriptional regulator
VQRERGFVLHAPVGKWDSVLKVSDEIGVATSRDILTAVAEGRGPEQTLVALGYAGWDAGQLEREVLENAWLSGPSNTDIIFEVPYEQRWDRAARLLGVDPERLSGEAGHS